MTVPHPDAWPGPQLPGPQFHDSPPPGPAPLDQPQYDATLRQAVSRFWRKFAVFSGRASRSEYWWWALVSFVVSVVLQLVGRLTLGGGLVTPVVGSGLDLRTLLLPLVPALVWSVVIIVPTLALFVRRMHDTNRSGWWYLLALPVIPGLVLELVALASINPEQLAAGDLSGLAVGPIVGAVALLLVGFVGGIILLVFTILGPDPRGARFDRSDAARKPG